MKNTARRVISTLLSTALACSMFGIPAYAAEPGDIEPQSEATETNNSDWDEFWNSEEKPLDNASTATTNSALSDETDENANQSELKDNQSGATQISDSLNTDESGIQTLESDPVPNNNTVNVEIIDGKPFAKGTHAFTVSLNGEQSQTVTTTKLDDGSYKMTVTFFDVDPGTYTVSVVSDKYKTYEQPLYVDSEGIYSYRVRLYTWDYSAINDTTHPGIIFYGDVTGEGDLNYDDVTQLVDVLHEDNTDILSCDLSETGDVSLVDLQIMSEGIYRDDVMSHEQRKPILQSTDENLPNVTKSEYVDVVTEGGTAESAIEHIESVIGNPDIEKSLKLQSSESISQAYPIVLELNNLDDPDRGLSDNQVSAFEIKVPEARNSNGELTGEPAPTAPSSGSAVVVYDEDGQDKSMEVTFGEQPTIGAVEAVARLLGVAPEKAYAAPASATIDSEGNIVINFGRKIAIKKVTIKITQTYTTDTELNLAEISSVEFLNDTEDNIGAPQMSIPTITSSSAPSKQLVLSWTQEENVTGYEVSVEANGKQQINRTTSTSIVITEFVGGTKGKIQNGVTYTVRVQSTNNKWQSGWSESIQLKPMATKVPDRPENVKATGSYKSIKVSWKQMEDTEWYNVYYRLKTDDNNGIWEKIPNVTSGSVTIPNLQDNVAYQIHVKGENAIGESRPSDTVSASTTTIEPANLPSYKLINTPDSNGGYTTHIKSARAISGSMIDSPNDSNGSAMGLFDGDFKSYYKKDDWDLGCSYNRGIHGIEITFDSPQNIGFISYAASVENLQYNSIAVTANIDGKMTPISGVDFVNRSDGQGRYYTFVRISGGITTDKILIGMSRYIRLIDIAEIRIHGYDSVEEDIDGLFTDEFQIQLADHATKTYMDELSSRLNVVDPYSGEEYPYKTTAQATLDFAYKLLEDENAGLGEIIDIDTSLFDAADNGKNLGISGLNTWQPLGKVTGAADEVTIYLATPNGATSGFTTAQLIYGQQNAEAANAPSMGYTMRHGKFVYPTISKSSSDTAERGGSLYLKYTGNNAQQQMKVRVLGASDIPMINVRNVDSANRLSAAVDYVRDLKKHVDGDGTAENPGLQAKHASLHQGTDANENLNRPYVATSCILNSTEVMTDTMLYSVPADRVLAGLKSGTDGSDSQMAAKLVKALNGTDQMMRLFYQHKGMMDPGTSGTTKTNEMPNAHLNIRMATMFAGAFMYAAGNHIGVGYPESANFTFLNPIQNNAPGETRSSDDGYYFGWGSAHEIGHNINDGRYAYAEVTNNYFAQLCRYINSGTTRFTYDQIYKRVSSGTTGRTGGVFTQLAMYWQLMLAHDSNEIYTMYQDQESLLNNRFFARVDSYARNPSAAPAPDGIALTTGDGESQNIIKLASAAAEKDLSLFFERWGLIPNATTRAYIQQFDKEDRALQYTSEETRNWSRANPNAAKVTNKDVVSIDPLTQRNSIVTMNIECGDSSVSGSILGYEIHRVTYESGKPTSEIIGFVKADESGNAIYTDNATFLGNRVVSYEVLAVDKFTNYSKMTSSTQIKLDGSGLHSADDWSVTTNMSSAADADDTVQLPTQVTDDDYVCKDEIDAIKIPAIQQVINGASNDAYVGKSDGEDPQITIDMKANKAVTSVRYMAGTSEGTDPISSYRIEASTDGNSFTEIGSGNFELNSNGEASIYFYGRDENGNANPWIVTETARYLRITAVGLAGKNVRIKALDIFGPTGDNVEFLPVEGQENIPAVGVLKEDYVYDTTKPDPENYTIKAGSIVFTGKFKGNPAFNEVILFNDNVDAEYYKDLVVGGINDDGELIAHQIILAEDPENALIGDTSDGRWIYWLEPGSAVPSKVRAELYRVDNAITSEGQRLVSDTVFYEIDPNNLPDVIFNQG